MKTVLTLLLFMFGFTWLAEAQSPNEQQTEKPQRKFVDLDGDGFNDLVPDRDGDGIPDLLDASGTTEERKARWAWYRSMPDSARVDSVNFQRWWESTKRPVESRIAWKEWRRIQHLYGDRGLPSWFDRKNPQYRRSVMKEQLQRKLIQERRRRMLEERRKRLRSGGN